MKKPIPISLLLKEKDERPQKGMWAPGDYTRACCTCHSYFIGDKRALQCATCAYNTTLNNLYPEKSTENKTPLENEILELLKKRANMPHEYINPNFLSAITELLHNYYNLEDEKVDQWIQNMWSA